MKLKYKLEKNNDISSSCSEVNYTSPRRVSLTNKPKAATEGGCWVCSSGLFLALFSIMHHSPRPQREIMLECYIGRKGCACHLLHCQGCPGELSSNSRGLIGARFSGFPVGAEAAAALKDTARFCSKKMSPPHPQFLVAEIRSCHHSLKGKSMVLFGGNLSLPISCFLSFHLFKISED